VFLVSCAMRAASPCDAIDDRVRAPRKCPRRAPKAIECGAPTSTTWQMEASSAITDDERRHFSDELSCQISS